jgi:uncharacterized protein (TIGR03382 family)
MKHAIRSLAVSCLLPACAAGVDASSPAERSGAIVNGYASTISDHPWQVSLQSGGHFCGASIIDAEWVLTANHCVQGMQASWIDVVVGATSLSEGGEQAQGVAEIVRYPGFSDPADGGDAALLRLSAPFSLGGNVQAIDLVTPADASAGATDTGVIANVSGWGTTSSGGWDTPDQLRAVDVEVRAMSEAEQYYGPLSDDQLAAGGDAGDSCQGDSGGPLTVETSHGAALAGIVSWGGGCAEGAPGMYTRVSAMTAWIEEAMTGGGGGGGGGSSSSDGSWMCDASWNGDGECDCGCGGADSDCPNATLDDCQYNDCDFWQPTQGLQVDPSDPTQCTGGVAPSEGEGEEEAGEGEGEGEGESEEDTGPIGTAQRSDDEDEDEEEPEGCQSAGAAPLITLLGFALVPPRRRRR